MFPKVYQIAPDPAVYRVTSLFPIEVSCQIIRNQSANLTIATMKSH
jgi:hypothetical protein